jgi:hypothetical protein
MQLKVATVLKLPLAFDSGTKIDKRSKDSASMLHYWNQTTAILGGISTMRGAAEQYLPKFKDETKEDYDFRLSQTKMTNIFRDIVESLTAKPFEQEIIFSKDDEKIIPAEIESLAEDIDGSGNNLTVFSKGVFFNGIAQSIDWIFVDYPDTSETTIITKADQKRVGVRPYWSRILGRNVLEARSQVIAGREVLTYFKCLEPGEPDNIRVFSRNESGQIEWQLYEKNKTVKDEWVLIKEGIITIDVIPVVPFITGQREGKSFQILPPLLDACDLQIDLYQQESALKYTKVLTAYPMLAGNGVKPEKDAKGVIKPISIGPARVLYAPPDGSGASGTWNFIEPAASSLTFLKKDISETQQDLRELGKQPLTAQSGNLTVITTAVAAGKARSAVSAWAFALKDTLENALVISCKWLSISEETYSPTVDVFTDFDNFVDATSDLGALATARAASDLSQETYWEELKRRKVLSADFKPDLERKRILDETSVDDGTGLDIIPNPNDPTNPKT